MKRPVSILGWAGLTLVAAIAASPVFGDDTPLVLATAGTEVMPMDHGGQHGQHAPSTAQPVGDPPLWTNLGSLSYPITTANPQAQQYFDQGLRLAYAFNHAEARRAFRKAQQLDPNCAMCYWGEALVLGPNINAPMDQAAVAPAAATVAKAQSLATIPGERERLLIEAVAARYSPDPDSAAPGPMRQKLDAAYAEAMGHAAARFPNDQDIQVLYAESLMDLQPWDYWQDGGKTPKGRAADIVGTLEKVLAANPDHPGAIHYYIHAVEASDNPQRAEPYAEKLAALMPGAGHIVHMPSHIYFRLGRYLDSLAANKAAIAADEAYFAQTSASGIYPEGYYTHNIHFLMMSAQMAGDGKTAIDSAEKLARTVSDDAAKQIAMVQPIKVAPLFTHAQFSDPATILALPAPADGLPYVEAMWHYARGVAFAAQGNAQAAREEADTIGRIRSTADFSKLTEGGIPAGEIVQLARQVVLGRAAQAEGNYKEAVDQFDRAASLEAGLPYMEPPYWYYPVRQSLGAALLMAGDTDRAEKEFKAALDRVPNNGWALYGLRQVYLKRGDTKAATETEEKMRRTWLGDGSSLALARL